jgi:GR25 family glycosyltransferase involved in LPS biosynthesis
MVYVINLPRRPERLDNFKKSFSNSDISDIDLKVISAVDGSDLSQIEGFTPESTMRIVKTGKRSANDELTPGMIGCYLSHYKTYEEFLKTDKMYALIFEDDAELKPNVRKTVNNLPKNWDIVSFGILSCFNCPDLNNSFTRTNDFYGTAGYIITREGAMKMMRYREKEITVQIDGLIGKFTQEGKISSYSVKNNLVDVKWFGTDIQQEVI